MNYNNEQFVVMTPRQAQLLLDMVQRTKPISLDEAIKQLRLMAALKSADDAAETSPGR